MPTYVVEAWWTTILQAQIELEASSPIAALEKAKRMLIEGGDDWIGDNHECDDSYGPTNLRVWDEGMEEELVGEPSDEYRRECAAGALLAALKQLLTAYAAATGRDPVTGEDGFGIVDIAIANAVVAIRAAQG